MNFNLTNIRDGIKYVKTEQFTKELRDFIFDELKAKSLIVNDLETAKAICSAKGDWVLRAEEGCDIILNYVLDTDYDEILILWHIATELSYNTSIGNEKNKRFRKISRLLSDYMMYLLLIQLTMMSAVEAFPT